VSSKISFSPGKNRVEPHNFLIFWKLSLYNFSIFFEPGQAQLGKIEKWGI